MILQHGLRGVRILNFNTARRFQMELETSEYSQGNKPIQEYFFGFVNLWIKFMELVYATVPHETVLALQVVHEVFS